MGGSPPTPLGISALNVNGKFGQRDFWVTNQNLSASIGAAVGIVLGAADYGRGDAHSDFGFVVPVAGAYPLHLIPMLPLRSTARCSAGTSRTPCLRDRPAST